MVTGELKAQIDKIWNDFWSGGISNPSEVIEQLTYLLFIKRLDDEQTLAENRANRLGESVARIIFPAGDDGRDRAYQDLRWSRFKHFSPAEMFTVVAEHVFPFLRALGGEGSTYSNHMADARFTIPTPALLQKAVDGLDRVAMTDRDTKGDVYEYMLAKIATAGQNGQFRTPRHIIGLMVEMVAPSPADVICDPACGTCGFLVLAGEYVRTHHPEVLRDATSRRHFHNEMFNGFDFDNTMLRIRSMNMLLHGVEHPDVRYKDSLAQEHGEEAEFAGLAPADEFERFRKKARMFLLEHKGDAAVEKIHHNWAITAADLAELQRVLVESGVGTDEDCQRAEREAGSFGLFIRRLVGLDRAAAKEAYAEFLDEHRFSANQIEFVNLVIDELSANGVIEPRRFYESPFTDVSPQGPDAIFEPTEVDRLLEVVADVRRRAEAA